MTKKANYRARYTNIIAAINTHAWDGKWYLRGYCDNGEPIGSHVNEEGRIYLKCTKLGDDLWCGRQKTA